MAKKTFPLENNCSPLFAVKADEEQPAGQHCSVREWRAHSLSTQKQAPSSGCAEESADRRDSQFYSPSQVSYLTDKQKLGIQIYQFVNLQQQSVSIMPSRLIASKSFFVKNYEWTTSAPSEFFSASIQGDWSTYIGVVSQHTFVDISAWLGPSSHSHVCYINIYESPKKALTRPKHRWMCACYPYHNAHCSISLNWCWETRHGRWSCPDNHYLKDRVWQKLPCFWREWTEESQLWRQCVSSTPATRLDVINLQEQLDIKLQQRQARETGICPVRRELYSQCFGEWEGGKFAKMRVSYKQNGRF